MEVTDDVLIAPSDVEMTKEDTPESAEDGVDTGTVMETFPTRTR